MKRAEEAAVLRRAAGDRVIAFAGNPNVGKTTLFNRLTGRRQHTGNWAGKTVGCACGRLKGCGQRVVLVDLPGQYALRPQSAEEEVSTRFLREGLADRVVAVCDAGALERNLPLVLELRALVGERLIVCVNLLDEAAKRGITVDLSVLETALGVPVVGAEAANGRGVEDLTRAMLADPVPTEVRELSEVQEAQGLRRQARDICLRAVQGGREPYRRDLRLDRLVTGRWTALPLSLLLLAAVFWFTMVGAGTLSDWLSRPLFALEDWLRFWLRSLPPWLSGVLLDGIYHTVAFVVSVMLPPMAVFFPLFTLLEEFGLLPRLAFNLDRCFACCGGSGKQALTMCWTLGCIERSLK